MNRVKRSRFAKDLETLINNHSMENGSDTPDFVLAELLVKTLHNFEQATRKRDKWYKFKPWPREANRRASQT